jgi:hypothetical protein
MYLYTLVRLVNYGDLNVRALVRDDGAGGASHVASAEAANLGNSHRARRLKPENQTENPFE